MNHILVPSVEGIYYINAFSSRCECMRRCSSVEFSPVNENVLLVACDDAFESSSLMVLLVLLVTLLSQYKKIKINCSVLN